MLHRCFGLILVKDILAKSLELRGSVNQKMTCFVNETVEICQHERDVSRSLGDQQVTEESGIIENNRISGAQESYDSNVLLWPPKCHYESTMVSH